MKTNASEYNKYQTKTVIKYDEIDYNHSSGEVALLLNGEVVDTLYLDCIIPEFLNDLNKIGPIEYKEV